MYLCFLENTGVILDRDLYSKNGTIVTNMTLIADDIPGSRPVDGSNKFDKDLCKYYFNQKNQ